LGLLSSDYWSAAELGKPWVEVVVAVALVVLVLAVVVFEPL